ncbi:MAG: DNA polymerase III subunit gamma/tau [Deltaproteobacteria bacterium]|nr:DNA polymerase III subunit gamma/tau [Deltaproteobacteria bacterium]
MYQVIARKYRPQRFADIVGQEHITKTLQNSFTAGRLHHAYLLTGIRGIGKTTLARIFAKILNCKEPIIGEAPEPCNKCPSCVDITGGNSIDVQEIDGASNTGVDDVREIRERVKFLPAVGKYKIYIIDEVHMLSTAAFNALLKTLEEPPAHVIFIFATTEVQKIPATILSRCQRYDFRRITPPKIIEMLKVIAASEGVSADEECLQIIAAEAEGSMRDAESLFDQAIAFAGKKLTYEHLKDLLGFLDRKQIVSALSSIVSRNAKNLLAIADELFKSGDNLNRFVAELLEAFHLLLLLKSSGEIQVQPVICDIKTLEDLAAKTTIEELQQWYNFLFKGADELGRTKFPKIVLDAMLINMAHVRPVRSIDELLARVESLSSGKTASSETVVAAPAKTRAAENMHNALAGFIDWLKLNKPQVASFLDSNIGGAVSDSCVAIKFASPSFASERVMEADRKAFLEKLASDFFKKPMKIAVEFEGGQTIAEEKKKAFDEKASKNRELKEEALKHEVIRGAANIFGAEIKEIKVK